MHIIDSHFHHWPRRFFEQLCKRTEYPRTQPIAGSGYNYWRKEGATGLLNLEADWFDLETQFAHMDGWGIRSTWSARSGRCRCTSRICAPARGVMPP